MHQYRIDLSIGMSGYIDADSWQQRDGHFEFIVQGEVKSRYPELWVRCIRRIGSEKELIVEYHQEEVRDCVPTRPSSP